MALSYNLKLSSTSIIAGDYITVELETLRPTGDSTTIPNIKIEVVGASTSDLQIFSNINNKENVIVTTRSISVDGSDPINGTYLSYTDSSGDHFITHGTLITYSSATIQTRTIRATNMSTNAVLASATLAIATNTTPISATLPFTSISIDEDSSIPILLNVTNYLGDSTRLYITTSSSGIGIDKYYYPSGSSTSTLSKLYMLRSYSTDTRIPLKSPSFVYLNCLKILGDTSKLLGILTSPKNFSISSSETITMYLRRDYIDGPILDTATITLNSTKDTITTDKVSDSVFEGKIISLTAPYTSSSQLYWSILGATTSDFQAINGTCVPPGSLTINGTTMYYSDFSLLPKVTSLARPKTFTVQVRTGSITGTIIGTKNIIVVSNPVGNQGLQVLNSAGISNLDVADRVFTILDTITLPSIADSFVLSDPGLLQGDPFFFYQGSSCSCIFTDKYISITSLGSGILQYGIH